MRLLSAFLLGVALLQPIHAGLLANSQGTDTTRAYDASFSGFLTGGYLGVTIDEFGRIYVADSLGDILQYSSNGTYLGVFGSIPSNQVDVFNGIAFGPDGKLYGATLTGDGVYRFNANGTGRVEFIAPGTGGLDGAYGLTLDAAGNLYVAGYNSKQIHKYNSSGTFLGNFTSGITLQSAAAPTFGPDGKLYVADFFDNKIHRFNGTTGVWDATMALTDELLGPSGLAFGPNGVIYASSLLKDQILTYNYIANTYTGIYQSSATDSGLLAPTYLAFTSVPEPGTVGLAGLGVALMAFGRLRKTRG
jgi:outer membrane protein assembly factor BamB